MARYPQLYSRIGFAHQYTPLDTAGMCVVLGTHWQQLVDTCEPGDTDDVQAANAIGTVAGENILPIERLVTRIARIVQINHLDRIAPGVRRDRVAGWVPDKQ